MRLAKKRYTISAMAATTLLLMLLLLLLAVTVPVKPSEDPGAVAV